MSEVTATHSRVLQHPDIQQFLSNSSTHFDVTFVSPLMNEMGLNFAHRFNSSVILYLAPVAAPLLSASMGYYENPSLAAQVHSMTGQQEVPGFSQRMSYFLLWMFYEQFKYICSAQQDQLWLQHFPNDHPKPDLVQLEKQASFAMYFSHYIFDSIRPTLPNTIDVGTIHCRSPKPVPDSLNKIISGQEHGFVMVSFGSWLQPEHMPESKLQVLIAALSRIPYLVLLKWKNSTQTFPDNIRASAWLPQQDLLGHSKILLFITQGGMMSVQESLCHGVPMVVLPIFGDQMSNGARIERQGVGRVVSLNDLTEDKLVQAIMEVINNDSYKSKAANLRDLLHDDIQTPLQRAIFWTEYVMRHPGARHLQSTLLKQIPAWKFFNLDLILVLTLVAVGCSALLTWLIWFIVKKCVSTLIL